MSALVLGLFFLACGWKFYKDFKYTRYLALKNSGHPQYFGGALCAAIVFLAAASIDHSLSALDLYKDFSIAILDALPFASAEGREQLAPMARMAFLAVPFVWVSVRLLNAPLHASPSLIMAVAKKTRIIDELEDVLYFCLKNDLLVLITLKSKKFYVGIPKRHSPDPDRDRYWLAIWPVASGCRGEDGGLEFTTFYPDFSESKPGIERSRNDFQLVLPLAEFSSAQSFDFESFNRFSVEKFTADDAEALSSTEDKYLVGSDVSRRVDLSATTAPAARTRSSLDEVSKISSQIVGSKDKYHLRCYWYYVACLTLAMLFVKSHPLHSFVLLVVSVLAAYESMFLVMPRIFNLIRAVAATRSYDYFVNIFLKGR